MRQSLKTSFLGISRPIENLKDKIHRFLPVDIPIFIIGNAGVGKDELAKYIHLRKNKDLSNFYKIDSAEPEEDLSNFFKKYFKPKANETINHITLYFDHIHCLKPEYQNILLKFIDTLELQVHKRKVKITHSWIILSSNFEISNLVQSGIFRKELYDRLSYKLVLPNLKERTEDIPIYVNHYLEEFKKKYKKQLSSIAPELSQFLRTYHWPGNLRQLIYLLEGMVALMSGRTLTLKNLPDSFYTESGLERTEALDIIPGVTLEEYEKHIIKKNLEFSNYNKKRTAKLLGISERNLYRKISEYKLEERK